MTSTRFLPLALILLFGAGCAAAPSTATPASETSAAAEQEVTDNAATPVTQWTFQGALPAEQIANKQIRITTDKGDIVFTLFEETAPLTVSNMVYLASGGFYNGLTFHRRVEGFVIQGGDPNGNGSGGPGYTIPDELNDSRTYQRGIVAMAKRPAPDTGGSQFFIMLADYPLPHEYTIFGEVTEGMDVVESIAIGDVMRSVAVEPRAE